MRVGRAFLVAMTVAALCLASRAARADTARRGLYIGFGAGPAYVAGSLAYGNGTTAFDDTIEGAGADLRLAVGYAPIGGLAVALQLQSSMTSATFHVPGGSSTVILVQSVGALTDWYPDDRGPLHLELGVGYVVSSFPLQSRESCGGCTPVSPGIGGDGMRGQAGAGLSWGSRRFNWGPLLEVSAFRATNRATRIDAGAVALDLSFAWF